MYEWFGYVYKNWRHVRTQGRHCQYSLENAALPRLHGKGEQ
jgi:hypothetical protein